MLRISGHTAGPIGLNFLWTFMGGLGVLQAEKNLKTFFPKFFFSRVLPALQLITYANTINNFLAILGNMFHAYNNVFILILKITLIEICFLKTKFPS